LEFYERQFNPGSTRPRGRYWLRGNRLAPVVLDAMVEASVSFVHIDQLQQAAGEVIRRRHQVPKLRIYNVTNRSGSQIGALATAACVARMDVAAMNRCRTNRLQKREILVQRGPSEQLQPIPVSVGCVLIGWSSGRRNNHWRIEAAVSPNELPR